MADLLGGWLVLEHDPDKAARTKVGADAGFGRDHAPAKRLGSAVGQEISLDIVAIGLEQNRGAAQLADRLLGPLDHAVALAGLRIKHLPGRRDLEALLGARLGLKLGHFALLFRSDTFGQNGPSAGDASIKCAD